MSKQWGSAPNVHSELVEGFRVDGEGSTGRCKSVKLLPPWHLAPHQCVRAGSLVVLSCRQRNRVETLLAPCCCWTMANHTPFNRRLKAHTTKRFHFQLRQNLFLASYKTSDTRRCLGRNVSQLSAVKPRSTVVRAATYTMKLKF